MPSRRTLRIAIDGPAGAGKSTAGRLLARRLGYRFLDTGQMYRAVTLAAREAGTPATDAPALSELAHRASIEAVPAPDGSTRIRLEGRDVTDRLTAADVENMVSAVSATRGVREAMVHQQRRIAGSGDIVMVGRDIGTVVLADAEVKFYLEASPETRADRRFKEYQSRGRSETYVQVLEQIRKRDAQDSSRSESPLTVAKDAEVIETDGLTLEQVVDRLEASVLAKA